MASPRSRFQRPRSACAAARSYDSVLARKVNEYRGQHRFGGGSDYDCDPHVMDVLGDQAAQLAYKCGPGGESEKMATLTMVRK